MVRSLKAQRLRFNTVIDGGANKGQFARAVAGFYPEASVIAFEPLPDVARTLGRNLRDCPRVHVIASALGDRDARLTFHRATYSLSSSALPLHDNHRAHFPGIVRQETIEVPCGRLDTLLAGVPLVPPVLLKLDLQGYELTALRGAPDTLSRTDYLLLETSFEPMYESEPFFGDVYAFATATGFELLRPLAVLSGRDGRIVQMDVLFRRRQPDASAG